MAGLFEAKPLAGVEQRLSQKIVGVLGTHGDQNFFLQRKHAALGQQTQSYLLNQVWYIIHLEVWRPLRQVGASQAVHAALPKSLSRKQLGVVSAVNKGEGVGTPAVWF